MKHLLCTAAVGLALIASPALAKQKIVVLMPRSDDTFINLLRDSMIAEGAQHPDLDVQVEDAHNDSATQISQIEQAVKDRASALIILTVDSASAQAAADDTAKAGVPLVFLNRLPPMDRFSGRVSIVASNDLVAGRLQMRLLSSKIGGQGNVVILRGEDGHPAARDRTAGVKEVLATKPGIHVVEEATGNWKREDAEKLVTQWLNQGVHIDAVAANNDEMALGAIAALQKAGYKPGQVAVGGTDGTSFGLEAIKSGYLTLSILQNAKAQARQAFIDAAKFANNEYAQLYDWVPYELIIPSNVDSYAAK